MKFQEHLDLLSKIPFKHKKLILTMLYHIFNEHSEEIQKLGFDQFIETVVIRPKGQTRP